MATGLTHSCSHLGLFRLPGVKTAPNRLKVKHPGLLRQNERDYFVLLQAGYAHSAYPPCHPPLHCQWYPDKNDKNKRLRKKKKMDRDGLNGPNFYFILLQRAWKYCKSSNEQRGLTSLTHLFILLRLLLILKLLVKSNTKVLGGFYPQGLYLKMKMLGVKLGHRRGERRVVESWNQR